MSDESLTIDEFRLLYRQRAGGCHRPDEHTMTDAEFRALRRGATETPEEKQ